MKKMKLKSIVMLLLLCFVCQGITGCGQSKEKDTVESTPNIDNVGANEKQDSIENNSEQSSVVSFSGKDMEGNDVGSASIFAENEVTMVNVWATYCQPCINELQDLQTLNDELKEEGIQVIGIVSDVVNPEGNYDQTNWDLGKSILKEKGVSYKNVMCDINSFYDVVNIDAVPTTFFVDKEGKLVGEVQIGSVDKESYKKMAEEALAATKQ